MPQYCTFPAMRVLRVSGGDAGSFIDALLSVRVGAIAEDVAQAAALLSPQGKIEAAFSVMRRGAEFFLPVPEKHAAGLEARLKLYRLRKAVDVVDSGLYIARCPEPLPHGTCARDTRHAEAGWICLGAELDSPGEWDWEKRRIRLLLLEFGVDYGPGQYFPADVGLDLTGGIDFARGCYVGQEVVSRMRHRGTLKRRPQRLVAVEGEAPPLPCPLELDGKNCGELLALRDGAGLAVLRIDIARAGNTVRADTMTLLVEGPALP